MPSSDNFDSIDESEKCSKEKSGTGVCSDVFVDEMADSIGTLELGLSDSRLVSMTSALIYVRLDVRLCRGSRKLNCA